MSSSESSASQTLARAVKQVDEMSHAVSRLTSLQSSMDERVRQTGRSSRATVKVAESISNVARATRMLSINASIEAARAGEMGAGFGIVALEVGSLAHRTADAADEAARLLGDCETSVAQLLQLAEKLHGEISQVSIAQKQIEASLQVLAHQVESGPLTTAEPSSNAATSCKAKMQTLVYDPARMSTGVESVDHQHRKLIEMIKSLDDAVAQGQGKEQLSRMLDFLATYVVEHFKHEECVFAQKQCPNAQKNKQAHAGLIQKYTQWRAEFDRSGASLEMVSALTKLLKTWLVEHICGVDRSLLAH